MFVIRATLRDETRRINIQGKGFPPYDQVQQKLRIVFNLPSTAHTFWANVLLFPDDAQLARIKFKQHVCDASEYAEAQQPFRNITLPAPALVFTVLLSSDPRLNAIHDFHRARLLETKEHDLAFNIQSMQSKLVEKLKLVTALEEKLSSCQADNDSLGVEFWRERIQEKQNDVQTIEKDIERCRNELGMISGDLDREDRLTKRTLREFVFGERQDEILRADETRDEIQAWRVSIEDEPAMFPPLEQVLARRPISVRFNDGSIASRTFNTRAPLRILPRAEHVRQFLDASTGVSNQPTRPLPRFTPPHIRICREEFESRPDMSLSPKGRVFSSIPIMQSRMPLERLNSSATSPPQITTSTEEPNKQESTPEAIPECDNSTQSPFLSEIESAKKSRETCVDEALDKDVNSAAHVQPGTHSVESVNRPAIPNLFSGQVINPFTTEAARINAFIKDRATDLSRSLSEALAAASAVATSASTAASAVAAHASNAASQLAVDDKKQIPAVSSANKEEETKVELEALAVSATATIETEPSIPGAFIQTQAPTSTITQTQTKRPASSPSRASNIRSGTNYHRDNYKGGYRHKHISCDGCYTGIRGMRYKCEQCPDYDLCGSCLPLLHTSDLHPSTHTFRAMLHRGLEDRVKLRNWTDEVSLTEPELRHPARCDLCSQDIIGIRWKCLNCPDWDACNSCAVTISESHPDHSFVKLHSAADYVNSAARDSRDNVAHPQIICDGCDRPLRGVRYKCMHPDCPDYDLCEKCESSPFPAHPATHPMLKIKTPLRVDVQSYIDNVIPGHTGNVARPPTRPHIPHYRRGSTNPFTPAPENRQFKISGMNFSPPPAPPHPPLGMSNIYPSVVDSYADAFAPHNRARSTSTHGPLSTLPPPQPTVSAMFNQPCSSTTSMFLPPPYPPPPHWKMGFNTVPPRPATSAQAQFMQPSYPDLLPETMAAISDKASLSSISSTTPRPRNIVDQDEEPAPEALAKPIVPDNKSAEAAAAISLLKRLEVNDCTDAINNNVRDQEKDEDEDGYDTAAESQKQFKCLITSDVPLSQSKGKAKEAENVSFVADVQNAIITRAAEENPRMVASSNSATASVALSEKSTNGNEISNDPKLVVTPNPITKDPVTPIDIFTWVRHITIIPGTVLPPGAEFTKTWRVQHFASGSEFNFDRIRLVHKSASQGSSSLDPKTCDVDISYTAEQVLDQDEVEISIPGLRVPNVPGKDVIEYWRFEDEKGVAYGQELRLRFTVEKPQSDESSLVSSAVIMPVASTAPTPPPKTIEAAAIVTAISAEHIIANDNDNENDGIIHSSVPPSTMTDDSDDDELVSIRSSAFSYSDISEEAVVSQVQSEEQFEASAPAFVRAVESHDDDEYDFVDTSEDDETADEL